VRLVINGARAAERAEDMKTLIAATSCAAPSAHRAGDNPVSRIAAIRATAGSAAIRVVAPLLPAQMGEYLMVTLLLPPSSLVPDWLEPSTRTRRCLSHMVKIVSWGQAGAGAPDCCDQRPSA